MKSSVFEYLDYVDFLKEDIKSNKSTYGYKAQLSEVAGCQRSYISQVLSGQSHLTVEQATGLAEFWQFNAVETDYFLALVMWARAGSKSLKEFLTNKIKKIKTDQENLVNRIAEKEVLSEEKASIYYSSWLYSAILMLLTVENYQNEKALADRLNLSEKLIKKNLNELLRIGLIAFKDDRWQPTEQTIHLPKDSKFNSLNHLNWRQKAVEASFLDQADSVHYTSVCSISVEDAEKIKYAVLQMIDESRKIVSPSKEEEVFCLTMDWFKV